MAEHLKRIDLSRDYLAHEAEYQEAIRKIKRYMEDEENLSKAASKIVKSRHALEEEEEERSNDN